MLFRSLLIVSLKTFQISRLNIVACPAILFLYMPNISRLSSGVSLRFLSQAPCFHSVDGSSL